MSRVIDDHRHYLADDIRLAAFERAIAATVRSGAIVADLGSGTGIFGLMACRAGAARVYSIESSGMIEVARALARDNGVADRVTFINASSHDVTLSDPCDVVVSDLIGRFGFEAGLFDVARDVARFLRPGGHAIPSAVTLAVAPVESPAARADVDAWSAPVRGFNVSAVLEWARNTGYPRTISQAECLSDETVEETFDAVHAPPVLRFSGTVPAARDGTLHGVAGWFRADLAPGVTLTNAPGAPDRIARRNVFLPIAEPLRVSRGADIAIRIALRPRDFVLNWTVSACGRVFRQSTLGGMLMAGADLQRLHPGVSPRLTARGIARGTVLRLCDGHRTLREIEAAVHRQHADLFPTRTEAEVFVAEVVSHYSEPESP